MPIRKELRHLYRGPAWDAIRAETLARAGNRCERCRKPHHAIVLVARDGSGRWRFARPFSRWRDHRGCVVFAGPEHSYRIRVVLTTAHLDGNPRHNAPANLAALCQHCHLKHDARQHYANARRTRAARRGQLWLSAEIERATEPL